MICNTASLKTYVPSENNPWTTKKLMHLYRRMGYSLHYDEIADKIKNDPAQLVDQILENAMEATMVPAPEWAEWTNLDFVDFDDNQEKFYEWAPSWITTMYQNGFQQKMTLFWHNHFVTQYGAYNCAPAAYKYLSLLQSYALGNFKTFVREVGKDAAMLIFLNGTQSTRQDPNENYARELFELFTLGRDNGYTQEDIENTSRALTGWVVYPCPTVTFISSLWDGGEKTIFGQTGNWGYDDVIDILFEQRATQIAEYIAMKIYKQFVYHTPNEDIIELLAVTLIENDFELLPVLSLLFKSEHFFDDSVIGNQMKSPIDIQLNFIRQIGFPIDMDEEVPKTIGGVAGFLGQSLFQPPNVAGWPGHRSWISSAHLRSRWEILSYYVGSIFESEFDPFQEMAKSLSPDHNDADIVTRSIVDYFLPNGLQNLEDYEKAVATFKVDIPTNYFENGSWSLEWDEAKYQVAFLILYIIKLPEFQMN